MTKCDQRLSELLIDGCSFRQVEEGIYSVLPDNAGSHQYDTQATAYDLVIGTRLYNRVMWGTSPRSYAAFASQAVNSHPDGWILDAACGSLLFSARAYLASDRPVVAFDQSLGMLRRARRRLLKLAGVVPERIILLQADLTALPLLSARFQTILCMNVMHHCQDAAGLLRCLKEQLVGGGQIYLTSLVANRRFVGDRYLEALHQRNWVARPRGSAELEGILRDELKMDITYWAEGNMAYAVTPAM